MPDRDQLLYVTNEMLRCDIANVGQEGVTKIELGDWGGPSAAAPVAVIWKSELRAKVVFLGPGISISYLPDEAPEGAEV